jgi:hypothetical protein
MSASQKWYATLQLLDNTYEPLSMTQIGRKLGFADGVPVKETICKLYEHRLIEAVADRGFGDQPVYRFYPTDEGSRAARERLPFPD